MPNYSLVMNSKFQPFSFERYIQPLQIYGQAYREQEDALAELDTKASIWEGMANEQTDPIAHAQYKKYADDLKAQATLIATEGLNPSSRQAMLNLRGRYAKEIVPIEQAYQRRAEQIAEQRKAGNQMIHSYDASTTSLDEFLGNPSLSYKSIDRAKLLQESTSLMSQFANELRDFRFDGNLDRFHKKLVESYGLTKDEATQFANAIASGTIDNNNAVQALAQHIYNSTGVADWNNATASNRVWQTIAEGVTAGIGKQSAKAVTDQGAVMAQQHAYAKELQRMKEEAAARIAAAKAGGNGQGNQSSVLVPRPGRQNQTTEQADLAEKVRRYKELLTEIKADPSILQTEDARPSKAIGSRTGAVGYSNSEMVQHQRYEKRQEFTRLAEELSKALTSSYPGQNIQISYSLRTERKPLYSRIPFSNQQVLLGYPEQVTLDYNDNIDNYLDNLATISRGYNYNITPAAMQRLTAQIPLNTGVQGGQKYNDYIFEDDGDKAKNSDLREIDWGKVSIYIEDGKNKFDYAGKTYILKPGALGDLDEKYWNQQPNGYRGLTNMWESQDYESFNTALHNYADQLYLLYNTQAQGQSNTSSNIDGDLLD